MLERSSFDELFREVSNICSFLGLRKNFVLDKLEKISSEDRDHLSLCDWIVTFVQNSFQSVSLTDKRSPSAELLASIGFDPRSSAVETIVARARNTQHHIDLCEMAEIFIRDQFKYKVSPSSVTCMFPLRSNITNTWFRLSIFSSDVEIVGGSECHVDLINLVTIESHAYSILRTELGNLLSKDDQNVVLFHGTDHLSACDILFRGIDLCQGRQKRDFSCGSGFYLTDNCEEALNWAKNTTTKSALLVFQVNRQEHSTDSEKLNLFNDEQRWCEIVTSFRSGEKTARTRKSLAAYDLIEGPVSTMKTNESTGELVFSPKPLSYQMCLISDSCADIFRRTLHSILFFDIC